MSETNTREARRHAAQPIVERFGEFAKVYVRMVNGTATQLPVPIEAPFVAGHVCSAVEARALNAIRTDYAKAVVESQFARGTWKDKPEAEQIELAREFFNNYSFTEDLGSTFEQSLLELAVDRVVHKLAVTQSKASGDYSANATAADRRSRAGLVAKILTDAALAEKYGSQVENEMNAVLSERPAKRTRGAKSEDGSGGLVIEL